jgi:hypothetical protein
MSHVPVVLLLACLACSKSEKKETGRATAAVSADIQVPVGEAASTGSYTVVVRAPGAPEQRIAAQRDGTINGRWVADVTGDGSPEILVWMTSAGSGSYGTVHVYEKRGTEFASRPIAALDATQRSGYMGHDVYEVANGALYRRFPEYASTDPQASPSGSTVRLRYSFATDRWVED